ncbi:hypothetical protein GUJ93_ZPchr0010g8734 [Zizania palustris]|nr:hypothetical protein GUJ93_ZPchr0010g8734 [Zizania palustris]
MDQFAIDSDSESYAETSDSEEDQEECEFTYYGHAQNILSSLDESIGKIDNFLSFERGFLHGDIVCSVSDPSGQLGRVVGVEMLVDLETSSGDIIKCVNSKKLSRVRSFVSGDCVVMGPWIGRVIRAFDLVTVVFSDGAKCEMLLRDAEVLKPIPPILFEDAPYFYYPGQRVSIVHPSISKSGSWLCGSWKTNRDEGVVCHVDVGLVHVNWITSVTNVWGDQSSSPPNFQDPKNLTLLSCFPYANWQLGDWCTLSADCEGILWENSGKSCFLSKAWESSSHVQTAFSNYGSEFSQTYVVAKTKSSIDVLWQNGNISLGLEPQTLVPVSTLGDHDFWPGQIVLEKLTVDDNGRCQQTGIVTNVDAIERTVNVKWTVSVDSDTVRCGDGPTEETMSAYELIVHPDFSFCTGEVVVRSAMNIDDSEPDLTNGTGAVSRESLDTSSGFLSCIGNVLGYKDEGLEVQWANGVISRVQRFEIIALDRILDNSLEYMNEEHTTDDLVDMTEQEKMHLENTKNALEESAEECTGSLRKATAFLFPRTAFDFLANVASSLFGAKDSTSSSSVTADSQYQIVTTAELQPTAELSEEKESLEVMARIEKPTLASENVITKRFDVVTDCSDHHFVEENGHENVKRGWVKKIQQEWTILQNDLPDGIHVRVYEERMDLLRACIVGAAGTPYHDNLFFFDIFFPPDYPHEPPSVHYHSGGLRLNPNLYESGKVCLSLLKTWTGTGNEVWNPENSTVLQLLLSLQALVLNEKPYFNEAGYDKFMGKADGEKNSITYNENAFLLSCKSMTYILHKPPKHFEKFVNEHFTCRARHILDSCEAYLAGDLVGHAHDRAYVSDDGCKNCSTGFKIMLGKLLAEACSHLL